MTAEESKGTVVAGVVLLRVGTGSDATDPRRLRCTLEATPTPITPGLTNGSPSPSWRLARWGSAPDAGLLCGIWR